MIILNLVTYNSSTLRTCSSHNSPEYGQSNTSSFRLYAAAAVLISSLVPYTFLAILPISRQLHNKAIAMRGTALNDTAAEAGLAQEDTAHALVDRWATVNMGRALLSGVSALCAAFALVSRIDVVGVTKLGFTSGANRLG